MRSLCLIALGSLCLPACTTAGSVEAPHVVPPRSLALEAAPVDTVLPATPTALEESVEAYLARRPEGWASEHGDAAPKEEKDNSFDHFARPVTNLNFNHPFIWSELRPVTIQQSIPESSVLGGGTIRLYAMQFWLAMSDDLQLVVDKSGWVENNPDALEDSESHVDMALGLKYRIMDDEKAAFALAGGLIYEFPSGRQKAFQGGSHGIWDMFLTAAQGFGDMHAIFTAGVEVPTDTGHDSTVIHYHAHLDYEVSPGFWPLIEINGFHYMRHGRRDGGMGMSISEEGGDLTNLGSSGVRGNEVITGAVGFRYELVDDVTLGATWEIPLTSREDLLDRRFTIDMTFRF